MATALPADELKADGVLDQHEEFKVEETSTDVHYIVDPIIEKRVTRKFDFRILPLLFGIWLFSFIDRTNVGFAQVNGMIADLSLTGNQYNIALTLFFVPYILVDVPSNWIIKHFRAGRYLPILIISWGLVNTFTGFVSNFAGLVVARIFLGATEGGLLGGMVIYLAMFYPRHQILTRFAIFYCAAPLSGAFGGLLATGFSQIVVQGYTRWPWIFFLEGSMTVLWGITALFFLPDTPHSSKFLTEEERVVAVRRMRSDAHGATSEDLVEQEHFKWHWVRMAFLSPNTWFASFTWFFNLVPLYSFALFLPTIIKSLGTWSTTEAQLLTAPPNFAAFLVVLATSTISDRLKARGPFILVGCLLAIAGYIMLLAGQTGSVKYTGTFFIACGVYMNSIMVMGWLSNNLAPHYVRATGTGFQIAVANCAAFISTFTYLAQYAPKYTIGHSINIGSLVLCMITVSCGIMYCKWENRMRDQGKRDHRLGGNQAMLGHRHPHFRYTI